MLRTFINSLEKRELRPTRRAARTPPAGPGRPVLRTRSVPARIAKWPCERNAALVSSHPRVTAAGRVQALWRTNVFAFPAAGVVRFGVTEGPPGPCRTPAASALAQAAVELPPAGGACDRDDVEEQALGRVAARDERDLAEEAVGSVVVAFRLQHLQILVVQLAAAGGFALVGGLDHGDVGHGHARHADQCTHPADGLPHRLILPHRHGRAWCVTRRGTRVRFQRAKSQITIYATKNPVFFVRYCLNMLRRRPAH